MSGPPDRLTGINTKLKRAEQHVREFVVRFQEFAKSKPYGVVPETDPEKGRVYRITNFKEPPILWAGLVGDVLHNLRAALDYLVWQLIDIEGKEPPPYPWASFPIFDSETDYEAAAGGRVKGVSDDARRLIDATHPYKGGNDGLWQLHRLNIVDKHRLLVPVIATQGNQIVDFASGFRDYFREQGIDPPKMAVEVRIIPRPLKHGDVIDNLQTIDASPGVNPPDDPQMIVNITLHEPGVIEYEPIGPTLSQFFELVQGVIEPFRPLLT